MTMTMPVTKQSHHLDVRVVCFCKIEAHLVKHREKDESGGGNETSPDGPWVAVRGAKGVGEEVHEGVPHQGANGQGDQQGEQGLTVSPLQKGHRSHSR